MNHQSQDFAGLRQCFQEVSRRNWEKLKEVLQEWEPETVPLALDYCERHLEHWPDKLRVVTESDASESPLPWWPLARSFEAGEPDAELESVQLLGAHPEAPPLRRLRIGDYYSLHPHRLLPCFLDNPQFVGLEALDISSQWDNGTLLALCAEEAKWKGVKELRYDWRPSMLTHLDCLLHDFWSSLERLELRLHFHRGSATDAYLVPILMGSPVFRRLKHLCLHAFCPPTRPVPFLHDESASRYSIELPGTGELLETPSMNNLETLELKGGVLPLNPWQKWLESSAPETWQSLTLDNVPLSYEHLEAMFSSPSLRNLRTLRLVQCRLVDNAMRPLLEASNLTALRTIDLMDNELTEEFAGQWIKTPLFSQLESVTLRRNNIAKKFKRKLKHMPGVEA